MTGECLIGVWGSDIFANDRAADYVHKLVDQMIEQVERTVASPRGMVLDERESTRMMCDIELMWLIGQHARLSMHESAKVERWKARNLPVWDAYFDAPLMQRHLKPGVKEEHRAAVVACFDQLIALCRSQER